MAELKQFSKEDWGRIPPQQCERIIAAKSQPIITSTGMGWGIIIFFHMGDIQVGVA